VRAAIGGEDVTSERVVLAVQGPNARARLAEVAPAAAAVARFGVTGFDYAGAPGVAAGTGYTGEDGVECALPAEAAAGFWRALIAAGVTPAGLGARDTLRLEAGLPLHGHELGPGITPLQAGLGWVVGFDKGHFRGREALIAERAAGPHRLLRGILGATRRPFRAGDAIESDRELIGEATSGNYSPVLARGIALAFCSPATGPGDAVTVGRDGTHFAAEVVKLPFHKLQLPE
jgi:aminomethyltransferase